MHVYVQLDLLLRQSIDLVKTENASKHSRLVTLVDPRRWPANISDRSALVVGKLCEYLSASATAMQAGKRSAFSLSRSLEQATTIQIVNPKVRQDNRSQVSGPFATRFSDECLNSVVVTNNIDDLQLMVQ